MNLYLLHLAISLALSDYESQVIAENGMRGGRTFCEMHTDVPFCVAEAKAKAK